MPEVDDVLITRASTASPAFERSRQCAAAKWVGPNVPFKCTRMTVVPLLFGHVHEHPIAQDARVVDDDIELTE